MPTFTNIILVFIAAFLLSAIPGPDMLYIIARGTGQGRAAGLLSSLGIATGGLLQTCAVALGLSGLFLMVPIAYDVIKYVGAVYLIYLGARTIFSRQEVVASPIGEKANLARVFLQGSLTTLLNPKVAFFYLAFLPQFVDQTRGYVPLQLIILGLVYNITGLAVDSSVAYLSSFLGQWIKNRLGAAKLLRWLTGGTFIGLGVRLAFSQRQ
ncbi:RhtB family transporter [Reticulibacter mediterranei]|uniref:RhtB family transporter n=1 Tax=Reticulibacter mediterranei TaxID=2778369 RepID=A0A8J3IJE3_9CHLR|nr:LysE family translocator [Reticulibacter mediterranei]GHO92524.1 RhtB family transporter [Reticulibacter mediterranei]